MENEQRLIEDLQDLRKDLERAADVASDTVCFYLNMASTKILQIIEGRYRRSDK